MRQPRSKSDLSALPGDYASLLAEVKVRVRSAQVRAAMAASAELLALHWDIGRLILDRQKREGWGAKVIDRLAADLQREFPGRQGFSPRNLKYMRAFAEAWPDGVLVQPVVARLEDSSFVHQPGAQMGTDPIEQAALAQSHAASLRIVHHPGAQLPWKHHCLLLDCLKKPEDRLWYAAKAVKNGWSRNILALQIDSGLHLRQGKAVTNFKETLPAIQSDLAQEITKDPYVFDFLGLTEETNERAVETGLLAHVEKFLLELGGGFALVGRQIHMEIGDRDFYLDLLFYHWKLRCFVVIDLKSREFTPEAAGKMNFYLSAVDELYRQPDDQPSIGLILCRAKNRIIAEYALRDVNKGCLQFPQIGS
jgi:predicted nuclease of restriction endonuclease-like (RecB) superfamily